MAEPPNLMPPRSACLPLDTKHPKENTKLLGSVGHTPRENPKTTGERGTRSHSADLTLE